MGEDKEHLNWKEKRRKKLDERGETWELKVLNKILELLRYAIWLIPLLAVIFLVVPLPLTALFIVVYIFFGFWVAQHD